MDLFPHVTLLNVPRLRLRCGGCWSLDSPTRTTRVTVGRLFVALLFPVVIVAPFTGGWTLEQPCMPRWLRCDSPRYLLFLLPFTICELVTLVRLVTLLLPVVTRSVPWCGW